MEFTAADLLRLEKLRLDRFREYLGDGFAEIAIALDRDNKAVILCDRPSQVDDLLDDPQGCEYGILVILGASDWSIYFAGEQVWERGERLSGEFPLGWEDSLSLEHDMVATLDRPTAQTSAPTSNPPAATEFKTLDELATQLANATGRGVQELRQEIAHHAPALVTFRGQILIDPSVADAAIDNWANWLKAQLRQTTPQQPTTENASSNGAAPAESKPAASQKTATKPATKKAAAKQPAKTTKPATTKKPAAAKKPAIAKPDASATEA